MRAHGWLRTWVLVGTLGIAGACGSGKAAPKDGGGGGGGIGGVGGIGGSSGGTGGADAGLAACLEMPGALPRPPSDRVPCELIPPGLRL